VMKLKRFFPSVWQKEWVQKLILGLYTSIIVSLSVFPLGLTSRHFGVSLSDSPSTLSSTFGYADAGSYLKAAIELNALDRLTQNQYWVINLWPPGMIWLDAALLRLSGTGFAIVVAVITTIIWTGLASLFALKVREKLGGLVAILSITVLLTSSPIQMWMLDSGLFYAEGISISAFLLGLIFLLRGNQSDDIKRILAYGISAGCSLAVAAYFRSTFSTIETGLMLFTLFIGAALLIGRFRRLEPSSKLVLRKRFALVGSAWLAMFTLMEPWLQFTSTSIRGVRAWSVVGGGFIRNVWVDRDLSADFMKAGGVGWGCEIDPEFCLRVAEYENSTKSPYPLGEIVLKTIQTALSHPIEYLSDRFHYISTGWFSNEVSMGNIALVWGFVTLAGFLLALSTLIRRALRGDIASAFIILACCLLILPEMIGHVEPRYFIPLKLLVLVTPWLGRGKSAERVSSLSQTPRSLA
jgi:hypothetical protein